MSNNTPPQGPGGSKDEAVMELKRKLSSLIRPTWIPVVKNGDEGLTDSKFSGKPVLKQGESWPACGNCNKPMQLFVQLNLAQIPKEAGVKGEGFIQMFYCTSYEPHCEVDCEAFFPFSKSTLIRLVSHEETAAHDHSLAADADPFPAKTITGWEEMVDYPGWEERGDEGIELSDEEEDLAHDEEIGPRTGEKLGGWPSWVQSVEYPSCPDCGSTMKLVFQVDSEQNLPYMWGDCGIGHITQCSEHPHRVAFGWACC